MVTVLNTTMNNNLLTVSEAAAAADVSVDTIIRWDKARLIRSHRSKKNYRLFNQEEVIRYHNKISGKLTSDYKILGKDASTHYTTLELFSGAGGTALGLENSGLQQILHVEIDKDAADTLRTNRPNWNILNRDISKVDFRGMRADIVEGGFPCQSFSSAGNQMGFDDVRGTLFFEFARAIKEVQPKIIIGENVRGLESHEGGKTLKTMLSVLNQIGYKVAYKILRAQYFDVPQKRERLIIIGVHTDLHKTIPILIPRENNYIITLKEALENVPQSIGQQYSAKKKAVLDLVPPGCYWRDLPDDVARAYMMGSYHLGGGKTGMARRMSWHEPSLTLTCSPSQKQTERCHPEETRPFTVREYARIQTFPDDWRFSGSISSQYKQIGNAVPCNLAYHLGKTAIAMLKNEYNTQDMELLNSVI